MEQRPHYHSLLMLEAPYVMISFLLKTTSNRMKTDGARPQLPVRCKQTFVWTIFGCDVIFWWIQSPCTADIIKDAYTYQMAKTKDIPTMKRTMLSRMNFSCLIHRQVSYTPSFYLYRLEVSTHVAFYLDEWVLFEPLEIHRWCWLSQSDENIIILACGRKSELNGMFKQDWKCIFRINFYS